MRILLGWAFSALLMVAAPFSGKVTDVTGAAVANASVTLICGGVERKTTSDSSGRFAFANVSEAVCEVRAEMAGFQRFRAASVRVGGPVFVIQLQVGSVSHSVEVGSGRGEGRGSGGGAYRMKAGGFNTENYRHQSENTFQRVKDHPLSTFSSDADTASYANARRFLNEGKLPPPDAVRVEEFLNYFHYSLPAPESGAPIRIHTELGPCPWNKDHHLLFLGLRTREIEAAAMPAANLVFLVDVSGSMQDPRKLPLLKQSFRLLVEQLRPQDRVAIVVYAGASGLVLEPTAGSEKDKILDAIQSLRAGGSTNGAAGIQLAYETARQAFIPKGNNRVILATDGDFNVGVSSDGDLVRLIEEKRKSGIFLTVLGYGMGNFKDGKLEQIANAGNGNYAYIDSLLEARKFLVREMGRNLLTVAKDVKLRVEFNPEHVQEYRLIGYENRLLKAEDFKDDRKDAGELGSGHTVVALYELVPDGAAAVTAKVDKLRYLAEPKAVKKKGGEALFVKVRYKTPEGNVSREISVPVPHTTTSMERTSTDFRFAAAVAEFGMLLSGSAWKGTASYDGALALAGFGGDEERLGLIELLRKAKSMPAPIISGRR